MSVIRRVSQTLLWIVVGGFALFGVMTILGVLDGAGQDPAGRGLSQALGMVLLLLSAAAGISLYLGRKSVTGPVLAAIILGLPFAFFAWFAISMQMSGKTAIDRGGGEALREV